MRLGNLVCITFALSGCATDGSPDAPDRSAGDGVAEDRTATSSHGALAARLQADVDTNHRDGVVGVLAQVRTDNVVVNARAGEARLGAGVPVAFDSRFRMGSNTKTFVAVVVLQLVGEGKLGLDDTVERWLPGVVAGNGNDGAQITIRQLLQHTSGIWNYTADLLGTYTADDYRRTRFDHVSPDELVAIAMSHPPNFAPGTSWSYSNTNYVLAGMVIQKVTGRDWTAEVRDRIIQPLQLSATFDPGDWPGLPAPHAEGYHQFADSGPLVDVTLLNHTWAGAAGSLVTTVDDLTRFWRALQSGRLLAPAQMADLHTTVPAPELAEVIPGLRYGLGILSVPTSCGGLYWAHFGDTFGFSTRNAVSEDGARAVVLSDTTTSDVSDSALQVITDDLKLLDDVMCAGR